MQRKKPYVDENGIWRSDHPREDGVIFDRDKYNKYMASIGKPQTNFPPESEPRPRPKWTRCCGPNRYGDTLENWEDYLNWLKTHRVGWTEEEQQFLIKRAEEQVADMRENPLKNNS